MFRDVQRERLSADRLEELKRLWTEQARKYNGLPLDDRSITETLTYEVQHPMPRQLPDDQDSQVFYPGTSEVPERTALQYYGRSFSVLADVDLTPDSQGVLFSHGGRFGGHSLFVKDHKLHYVYNWLGKTEQHLTSAQDLPAAGRHVLGVRFHATGHDGPAPSGTASLHIDQDQVAELAIKIQPGHFSLAGEGINAGRDAGQPVSSQYASPFEFTGGTLHQVVLERGDDPYTDLERHMAAAFARD